MKKIRVAIIGVGHRGMYTYAPCLNENPGLCELVAIVEPKKGRRDLFKKKYSIKDEYAFDNLDEFFKYENIADAVIIATNDHNHYEIAKIALEKGYNVLLEKPMANRLDGVVNLDSLCDKYTDRVFMICNSLRYTLFFNKLKHIIDSRELGDLISINYDDNISFYDFAHNFVRGNLRNSTDTSQLTLSKGCSDIDILLYLSGDHLKKITSVGNLEYFNKEKFKSNMSENCLSCNIESDCPYSAKKIYVENDLEINTDVHLIPTKENLIKILKKGPYGKCVYRCDNNVYDNTNSILQFKNGVNATLNISGFNKESDLSIKLKFSHGEVVGSFIKNEIIIKNFNEGKDVIINPSESKNVIDEADRNMIYAFITNIQNKLKNSHIDKNNNVIKTVIESHVIAFAAEYSIVSDETVYIDDFFKSAINITKEIDNIIK